MSFVLIHVVEEDSYAPTFDGRTLYHAHRSLCEPGTNHFVKARGPEDLSALPTRELFERAKRGLVPAAALVGSIAAAPLPPGFVPSFEFVEEQGWNRRAS